jgi:hypothetical protein
MSGVQNCAPVESAAGGFSMDDPELRIIEGWSSEKIQFATTTYYVESNVDSVNIEGRCSLDNGSEINWQVFRGSDTRVSALIRAGTSGCEAGRFEVALRLAQERSGLNSCAEFVEVRAAEQTDGQFARTQIRRLCL